MSQVITIIFINVKYFRGEEFHLCANLTSKQMSAWGTSGFKLNFDFSNFTVVANTDPLRLTGTYPSLSELPPTACPPEVPQPNLYKLDFHVQQYYLAPTFDPSTGQGWYEAAKNPLYRKNIPQ